MSIRKEYENLGVKDFYKQKGLVYKNPHIQSLQQGFKLFLTMIPNYIFSKVLDYGCGSGEISQVLKPYCSVEGADPYTKENYEKNTGLKCYPYSFEEVDKLNSYSTVVFSYCLHLLEQSKLPDFLYKLSLKSEYMIIISPHKKPEINSPFWRLEKEIVIERIRYRLFKKEML